MTDSSLFHFWYYTKPPSGVNCILDIYGHHRTQLLMLTGFICCFSKYIPYIVHRVNDGALLPKVILSFMQSSYFLCSHRLLLSSMNVSTILFNTVNKQISLNFSFLGFFICFKLPVNSCLWITSLTIRRKMYPLIAASATSDFIWFDDIFGIRIQDWTI